MDADSDATPVVLLFNDTLTIVGHFLLSPREREKRNRRHSRELKDKTTGKANDCGETEEIKHVPFSHRMQSQQGLTPFQPLRHTVDSAIALPGQRPGGLK